MKDHDIAGTLKDMDGNPVPKPGGGYWDHLQEMQNTLRGLRRNAETLKNVNNPEAQAAYRRATDAINKIESAIKRHGILLISVQLLGAPMSTRNIVNYHH